MSEVKRGIKAVNCVIVHIETAKDIIVRTEDGKSFSLQSDLPGIEKGVRGQLIIHGPGHKTFVREPFGWDDESDR